MEHRLLEYFMAVCEELHFTRAAEKLGISQPTLSQQIRLLEQRLETPLFKRIGKKTFLTEAGEVLHRHALRMFQELDQAQAALNELRGMQRGRLRIGSSGNHLLTSTIASFHARYPGVGLSVSELATEETIDGLLTNKLDIGIVFLPVEEELLETVPLFDEELVLVVSSKHELASRKTVAIKELQQIDLVLLQSKFLVRQLFEDECVRAGFTPRPIAELSSLDSLLRLAIHHVGGAIVPKSYAVRFADHELTVSMLHLTDPTPRRTVGIVYPKQLYRCVSVETFMAHLIRDLQSTAAG